ncbi:N-(5'-phosphoribosyl)anthranilate isomerase [Methylobacterium sp. Leaf399]|uniref:phosphoribosylanthranilate isomerase n=1 Tax=Methylobacterium sp. Leaf399 TaxID=1736364 RepID=UPI0006F75E92|nr:phosphoribosylanthranilate isomerase [Methylobacterium sp. Leaf399]KQT07500.1 N-(5'-phosphoribosyl)anthranilate isomerase [Methylobacterium sp. Leaf399]
MPETRVKICGLSTADTLEAALDAGADLVGFVHFPKSPRHVDWETGARLSAQARGRAGRVLLLVDPDDALLAQGLAAVEPDLVQLHGSESPERVAAIRKAIGRPVIKAIGIARREDLAALAPYAGVADILLLDAKPPTDADLPGGNGHAFDWDVLAGAELPAGTMLSGGLTPQTVAQALRRTGLGALDVSSGVERAPGVKDPDRIRAFMAAARAGGG